MLKSILRLAQDKMFVLDVIPLIPLPRNQPNTVSYFYERALEKGQMVRVMFNNRKIKGVVVSSSDVAARKADLKKHATFTLKKITKVLKDHVTEEQIKKAHELSDYYIVPFGLALRAVVLHPDEKNYKKYLVSKPMVDLYDIKIENPKNKIKIVDMKRELRDANYSIFSRALKDALQTFDKLIIFIPRKGYENFLLCKDCGQAIKCPHCSTSLVPYQGSTLKCHHCGHEQLKPKTCPSCNSYNLKPYGVGMDKVEVELEKFFKYQNLAKPYSIRLTSETKKLPDDFQILLATQALFKYKNVFKIKFLCIMNSDTLIHIPDYSAEEKLLKQTLLLASMADTTLVQTYNPDDPALVAATTGTVKEFWERELEHRKLYGYPPFTKLIKLTYRHRDSQITQRVARNVAEKLGGTPYPALISRERGQYVWHVLLKISNMTDALRSMLYALPPDWTIDVDPVSIV